MPTPLMKRITLALLGIAGIVVLAVFVWWPVGGAELIEPLQGAVEKPLAGADEEAVARSGDALEVRGAGQVRVSEAASPRTAPCVVRVLDEWGQPLEGVEAWWLGEGQASAAEGLEGGVLRTVGTEEPAVLLARAPGHQFGLLELTARSGTHDLVLGAAAAIHGLILVDGGLPPEPLELRFTTEGSPSPALERAEEAGLLVGAGQSTVTTDRNGGYRLDGLDPAWAGRVRLPRGYWFSEAPEGGSVEQGRYDLARLLQVGEVQFQLTRLPSLRGRLVWADDGAPVMDSSLMVSAGFEGGGQTPVNSIATDSDGRFSFVVSPSSFEHRERFLDPEQREAVREVNMEVQAAEGPTVQFELGPEDIGRDGDLGTLEVQRGRELHFRVVDQTGQPIEGALALVGGQKFGRFTDVDGRGVVTGLEERVDLLSVAAPGPELVHLRPGAGGTVEDPLIVTLGPGNLLALQLVDGDGATLPGLSLELSTGEQLFDDGGEPELPGLGLFHHSLNRGSQRGIMRGAEETRMMLVLDEEGRVSVHGLADGVRLTLDVVSEYGEQLREESFSGPVDGERMERKIVFSGTRFELRGRIVDESGEPLPTARVRFQVRRVSVDQQGHFTFGPLYGSTDPYRLEVEAEGHARLWREELYLTGDTDLGDLVLPAGRTVLVELRDEVGAAVVGAHPWALAEGFAPVRGRELEPGLMELRDLPPGEVEVQLSLGWREYTAVAASGVERVRLTVPVHGALELDLPEGIELPEDGSLVAELVWEEEPEDPKVIPFREDSGRRTREVRVLPGRYTIRLVHRWHENHELRTEPFAGSYQVEVSPGGVTRLTLDR